MNPSGNIYPSLAQLLFLLFYFYFSIKKWKERNEGRKEGRQKRAMLVVVFYQENPLLLVCSFSCRNGAALKLIGSIHALALHPPLPPPFFTAYTH